MENITMLKVNTIGKKHIVCPQCNQQFPIIGHVVPVPKGSGGCKAYATCPHCKCESCISRDAKTNEPTLQSFGMPK